MSTPRKVLIVVAALIIVPVLLFAGWHLVSSIVASGRITAERKVAGDAGDKKFNKAIDILKQTGTIKVDLASSKSDVCYIDSNDGGWFANSWYQSCHLRYIAGFTTNLTRDEIAKRAFQHTDTTEAFGSSSNVSWSSALAACTDYSVAVYDGSDYVHMKWRKANTPVKQSSLCDIPVEERDSYDYIVGDVRSIKNYSTFDSSKIDNSQDQIWLTLEESYYHENLGCIPLLFCSNPRPTPVHPEL